MTLDARRGDDMRTLRVNLSNALMWVKYLTLENPSRSLRQQKTQPPYFLDRKATVDSTCSARRRELGYPENRAARGLGGGRLLGYWPDDTLSDGAARAATDEFFDEDNLPPWDTWIAYLFESERNQLLVSWIAPELVDLVSRGVNVNPEGCILWLDELDSRVPSELRHEGLLP